MIDTMSIFHIDITSTQEILMAVPKSVITDAELGAENAMDGRIADGT